MKEQLFEILKVRRDVVYGDIPGLIADIEHLVNQEVEKRIKERMPTKIDAQKKIFEICSHPDNIGKGLRGIISTPMKLEMYDEWYRSRLTPQVTPQDTPQEQKTEGGGE